MMRLTLDTTIGPDFRANAPTGLPACLEAISGESSTDCRASDRGASIPSLMPRRAAESARLADLAVNDIASVICDVDGPIFVLPAQEAGEHSGLAQRVKGEVRADCPVGTHANDVQDGRGRHGALSAADRVRGDCMVAAGAF